MRQRRFLLVFQGIAVLIALLLPNLAIGLRHTWVHPFYKETNFVAQHKWFAYVMKGVNPRLLPSERAAFGLEVTLNKLAEVRQERTGEVAIKRVRIARSLGVKAQQQVAWINPHPITCIASQGKRFDDSEHNRGITTRRMVEVSEAMRRMHDVWMES